MQVIVLAIFCGVILSMLGEKVKTVKRFLQEFDVFITTVIGKINIALPLLIFAIIENTALGNSISSLISFKTVVIAWAIAIFVQLVLNFVFVSVFGKMSIASYYKKAKEPLIISLLSASSVIALPYNMDACKKNFGMDDKLVNFGIPIGQVLFMPCSAVVLMATCVGIANISGTTISFSWIITAVIISIVLAVATPPIPGSALMVYSLLFTQMNFPAEYIGATIALGVVTDNIVTSSNLFSLHYLLLKIANKQENKKLK